MNTHVGRRNMGMACGTQSTKRTQEETHACDGGVAYLSPSLYAMHDVEKLITGGGLQW